MMDVQDGVLSPMGTREARGTATAADVVDDHHEVMRGVLVRKASPSFEHSATQGRHHGTLTFLGNALLARLWESQHCRVLPFPGWRAAQHRPALR